MIARLRGRPAGRTADGLVLDVNGVGYLVSATPTVLRRAGAGSEVTVETYLHVREDALQLYGFGDAEERELFVHLLTVSGVGPKVALAVVSFLYFNIEGVKEHGLGGYLKHFMGPLIWIAPLFFIIEIIGTFARILSLSLRLFMNIFGEHTTTNVFASLVPIVVPWPMMALGIFTAFLQAYVFALLSGVYVGSAVAHEEH